VALNGSALNGSAALLNGAANGVNGSPSSALAAAAAAATIDVVVDASSVMDPCEVGQLEACAQERLAERDADEAALLAREAAQKAETRAGRGGGRGASANEASSSGSNAAVATKKKASTPYSAPGGRWGRFRKYSALQRSFEIWSFAVVFFFKLWLVGRSWTYPKKKGGMTPETVSARRATLASWLREGLVKLGPTFIKVGQQFSTRVDVLSPEFVAELEKLQDNVPPFDSKLAVATVERNLGGPVSELFDEFDPEPIAAASLGQVHLARLNGERVVVKVQRPGLKQLFDIDLKNVRLLARWLQAVDPKSDGAARDWVAIYDECSRILYQEIDYTLEGKSADRFRECFKDTDWVKVPRVLWERTASEVLTMEYAPGIKVNRAAELDAAGVDRSLLARRTVESYLQQLLTHGFFHADPHPGNVAADAGAGGGRLIYYDFGMMGQIPTDVRGGLLELFYGVYQKDPDRCIDALFAMGVLVPGGDRTAVRRTAQFFLDSFQERLDAQRAEAAAVSFFFKKFFGDDKGGKKRKLQTSKTHFLFSFSFFPPFPIPQQPNQTTITKISGSRGLPLGLQAGGHQGGEEGQAQADPLDDRRGPLARLGRQALPLPRHLHLRRSFFYRSRRHRQVARPQVRHHRDRCPLRAQPAPRGGQGRDPRFRKTQTRV
jgi:predicted unusual protein kinase regulating ubiquinone biosynthesis (AarF/ABC1/UbiB family)